MGDGEVVMVWGRQPARMGVLDAEGDVAFFLLPLRRFQHRELDNSNDNNNDNSNNNNDDKEYLIIGVVVVGHG